ncbi:MAG: divalent-cation tolerance protein CutA [Deltaproteobacteria bacterium]|nr:divalent-cation tolerance protein CutA [Deltaproteobacteria bacterium]MBW1846281.1 divalent-cation tolerance protein CutA [Deltaproteobacteria bacterium]MBW1983707.1 divalent-cation tolerance protein CutA [Deltaproteobacteria bacterium]MBW2365118.1 divalent-cation tolerance protein CutA [Deltaproteobacteria bacterium]
MKINLVYMTAGTAEEAESIGKELVSSGLAACVNIIENMKSIYFWEGELQKDAEVVLIAKTIESNVSSLIEKVKLLHSYDCPCVISLPVLDGNKSFMDWIEDSVKKP